MSKYVEEWKMCISDLLVSDNIDGCLTLINTQRKIEDTKEKLLVCNMLEHIKSLQSNAKSYENHSAEESFKQEAGQMVDDLLMYLQDKNNTPAMTWRSELNHIMKTSENPAPAEYANKVSHAKGYLKKRQNFHPEAKFLYNLIVMVDDLADESSTVGVDYWEDLYIHIQNYLKATVNE